MTNKTTHIASNGITVVMHGTPDYGLVEQAMTDLYRKVRDRKGENENAA